MNKVLNAVVILPFLFSIGCSSFIKQTAIDSTGMVIEDALTSFFEEEDVDLAEAATPSNLKLIEGLIKGSPNNPKLLLMGCRLYTSYAFGFIQEVYSADEERAAKNNKRAKAFHLRAKDYGFRVLEKNPDFKNTVNGSYDDFDKALKTFGKDQVEPLFWTAYAWANLIDLSKDDTDSIANLGKVESMMKRVMELDENYYNAGPHLFYMVYYGSRPPLLGGNPEKAAFHYNKAKEINQGKFLMEDVMYAMYYAVQVQDRELFEKLLKNVLDTPGSVLPRERLTNELAKRKAETLLSLADELF
jgi:hypothetical protein